MSDKEASPPQQQTLTFQQALDLAVEHHTSGDLPRAESIYNQILQADPNQPQALHLLGVIAHQGGHNEEAVELIEKSLAINPDYVDAHSNLGNALRALGRAEEAIASYKRALSQKPDYAAAHYNLGNVYRESGLLDDAISSYEEALIFKPNYAEAHNNLGVIFQELKRLDEAAASIEKAIEINTDYSEAFNNLGVVLEEVGKISDALASCEKAIALDPNYAEAYNNRGSILEKLGRSEEAITSYQKALSMKPDYANAYINLGVVFYKLNKRDDAVANYHKALALKPDDAGIYKQLGAAFGNSDRLDDAIACYRQALALKPSDVEVYHDLANTQRKLGKLEEAMASCRKAIELKPDYAEAHNNLGNSLLKIGLLDEAMTSYEKAIAIKPDFAEAHNNCGNVFKERGQLDTAKEYYLKALALEPNYAVAHINLGSLFYEQGNIDEAVEAIDAAVSYQPEKVGWRVKKALLLPIIPSSQESIETFRDARTKAIPVFINEELTIEDPALDVGITNFYLAYHGQNNRSLMQDAANLYITLCPKLSYQAKHCQSTERTKKEILRIGFLSSHLRAHTIANLTRGIIEHLSRDLFEVIIFRLPGKKDEVSEAIDETADQVVSLYQNLERDHKIIEDQELDILFYPDIGMDPYTYYLSFARLAPVQAVTWGHPDTTGIPNIDYFISSALLEVSDASSHYSEELIELPHLPAYYYPLEAPEEQFVRGDFDLPGEGHIYVCLQTLFKFHPGFDDILGELLRRDTGGYLVLIDDHMGGYWQRLLHERFSRAFPDVVDRVIFVPHMSREKYLSLLILADVVLDIPTFSGGNSSFEALAMGSPIITWPQEFMRGRVTAAFYKQMGLSDLIVNDADAYVGLALRLATDTDFKRRVKADIKGSIGKLYERHETVREMESFFIAAYEAWRKGDVLKSFPGGK